MKHRPRSNSILSVCKMTYVNEASVIATSVIFIVLGVVAVSLRFLIRRNRKVTLGADDWLIVVALV